MAMVPMDTTTLLEAKSESRGLQTRGRGRWLPGTLQNRQQRQMDFDGLPPPPRYAIVDHHKIYDARPLGSSQVLFALVSA